VAPATGTQSASGVAAEPGQAGPAGAALPKGERVRVLASFYPLYEVVRRVGGERVDASNLVAAGAEPHDLELTPRDLERLRQTRLVVHLGGGFQPGLEKALQSVQAPNLVSLDILAGLDLLQARGEDEHEGESAANAKDRSRAVARATPKVGPTTAAKADVQAASAAERQDEGRPDGRLDTHVWLDPVLFKETVAGVSRALAQVDPTGQSVYESNAQRYQAELDVLHQEFQAGLRSCKRRELVTSHAAFGYLARRYGLEQLPIAGLSPEAEPSPQRMQEVVQVARQHDVKVVYFETLVNPRVAEAIAREIGARTMVLNPIEGLTREEEAQGKTYLDLMRQNLANLRAGLECT
jgi:zinc transport system substrate-binding protein